MATEPNVKDKHDDTKMSDRMKEYLSELRTRVKNDEDDRLGWKRKLVLSNNQRLGVKRASNRPYPGAPNIPLPESDKIIGKQKVNYVMSIMGAAKKCFVEPAKGQEVTPDIREKAHKAEMGMNFVLNQKIKLEKVLELAADYSLEKGHALFKVIERFNHRIDHKVIDLNTIPAEALQQLKKAPKPQLEQFLAQRYGLDPEDDEDVEVIADIIDQFKSGKEVIRFDLNVVESFPDILVPPPEDVTPANYAINDLVNLERITHEFFLTERQLRQRAEKGIYNKDVIDKLDTMTFQGMGKSPSENDFIDNNKNRNEGIIDEDTQRELFRLKEISTWWQEKEDGPYDRWVFTFLADVADSEDALVQKIKFPFELDSWNYVKYDSETKDIRWHASRGVPERIRALQEFMEKAINNLLIRDEINNAPMYTVLSNSSIQSSTIRFIPGQKIKVRSHDEIRKLEQNTLVDISSERTIQLLKAFTEEYAGVTDQLFKNATNKGGGKTLGEVQLGVQLASGVITLDIMRWFSCLREVYIMIFKLMRDRLGESIFVDGLEITKEDFNFEPNIIPNGSLDLANRELKLNKAMQRLQLTIQGPPDIITAEDRYNAYFDFYSADDVFNPDRYITRPEIIQQQMQQQMQGEDQILAQQEKGLDSEINAVKQGAGQADARERAATGAQKPR